MSNVVAYLLQTPDGTIIRSYHVHDYRTYKDRNGKDYMIDGGNDYCRRSANGDEIVLVITDDMPHSVIRQFQVWGTRGKDGKQPVQYKPICELDTDHINAILDTQTHISNKLRALFDQELQYRLEQHE